VTYEYPREVKVQFRRLRDVLDCAANPDRVVIVVVRAYLKLDRVLCGHEVRSASLVVEAHRTITEEVR
jgi:hypothetical protein